MIEHEPAFTVIVPTFNRAHLLPRAIQSVLGQTFADFELIIVDDGSTDNTRVVVQSINDARVRYIRQENRGVSAARNAGFARSVGQFVTFLDSDDEALSEWLAHFARVFQADNIGVVCAGVRVTTARNGGQTQTLVLPRDLGPLFSDVCGLFLSGAFALRSEIFEAVGGYAEELVFSENTELALRLVSHCASAGYDIACVAEPVMVYHKQPFDQSKAHTDYKARLKSVEYVLACHRERFSQDRRAYGNYLAVAGVCAAKENEYRRARRYFWSAILAYPWYWKHYCRLSLAFVPSLGHWFWLRHDRGDDS